MLVCAPYQKAFNTFNCHEPSRISPAPPPAIPASRAVAFAGPENRISVPPCLAAPASASLIPALFPREYPAPNRGVALHLYQRPSILLLADHTLLFSTSATAPSGLTQSTLRCPRPPSPSPRNATPPGGPRSRSLSNNLASAAAHRNRRAHSSQSTPPSRPPGRSGGKKDVGLRLATSLALHRYLLLVRCAVFSSQTSLSPPPPPGRRSHGQRLDLRNPPQQPGPAPMPRLLDQNCNPAERQVLAAVANRHRNI